MLYINWDTATLMIVFNKALTEDQIKEGLDLVQYAKIYYKSRRMLPRCIILEDRKGNILHKIMVKGGEDCTETIQLPLPFMQRYTRTLCILAGVGIVYLIVRKYNS